MSSFVYDADAVVKAFLAEKIGTQADWPDSVTIAITGDDGSLWGAFLFDQYFGHDIRITIASNNPRWVTKANLGDIFYYPFVTAGCVRLSMICDKKNKAVRKLAEGVGFKLEGTIRKGLDGKKDALYYGLLKEDAEKWLKHSRNNNGLSKINILE